MATGDYILHKMNSSSDWEEKVVLAESGKFLAFNSNLDPVMQTPGGGFSVATKTSLTIDLNEASYFIVTISASSGFTLTNVGTGLWTFLIKNSGATSIDISIPTTANNVYPQSTVTIPAGKRVEISLVSNGTLRIWSVGNTLTDGA